MAATAISSATTTRTAGTLAAGDNVPLGATGLKAKIAASELLEGLANVTGDAAGSPHSASQSAAMPTPPDCARRRKTRKPRT